MRPHVVAAFGLAEVGYTPDPQGLNPPRPPWWWRDFAAVSIGKFYGEPEPMPILVADRVEMLQEAIGSLGQLERVLKSELQAAQKIAKTL
ncbi:hypothetical protein [Ornithinimicrobium sp. INDO-MA30-4]|uniref:hypothetical protein n=1 Tax=Ornithinimicrobium sp. INDO-MA30-4 TaxID=2908651 RepID=UPI001F2A0E83|nr:hypothetical protein [Ornithinimicrobium sp. INDO-MA30-4]UJH70411.1 hypothetical protein L0A91_15000 [Ornithinimicrobium sp. INDO-MA30-4]